MDGAFRGEKGCVEYCISELLPQTDSLDESDGTVFLGFCALSPGMTSLLLCISLGPCPLLPLRRDVMVGPYGGVASMIV